MGVLKAAEAEFVAQLEAKLPGVMREVEPRYLEEQRNIFAGIGAAVACPRTTEEVATIMRSCAEARVPVVPYGGGTGLVGAQTVTEGPPPIILSLEAMDAIESVDPVDNVMVVQAGAILETIQNAAEGVNRLFPLALASQGSCRIGGNLATNAGGVQVLAYGSARALCLGVEAVMPDGSILNTLSSLRKDNTGYDLKDLLIGSEGTLGVITRASLRLFPLPEVYTTGFLGIENPAASVALLERMQQEFGSNLSAFELIDATGVGFFAETGIDIRPPLESHPDWMVLCEAGGGKGGNLTERMEAVLERAFEDGLVSDAVLAQSIAQRKALWDLRENLPEGNRRVGSIASTDISVPISLIAEFIERVGADLNALNPVLRVNSFGHVGDGNLHYNVFPPVGESKADYMHLAEQVKATIYDVLHEMNGSISAEHGIGRLKRRELAESADPVKLAVMRQIKAALDPHGIMNPGAVLATN